MTTWHGEALCRLFSNLPWIEEPERVTDSAAASMGVVCDVCPVRRACEDYVADHEVLSGFWAGRDRTPPAMSMDGVA